MIPGTLLIDGAALRATLDHRVEPRARVCVKGECLPLWWRRRELPSRGRDAQRPPSSTSAFSARQPISMTAGPHGRRRREFERKRGVSPFLVEAAGIEPASRFKRKERWRATSVARVRFSAESVAPSSPLESPTVPWSPPQSWRHCGDGIGARAHRAARSVRTRGSVSAFSNRQSGSLRYNASGCGFPVAAEPEP